MVQDSPAEYVMARCERNKKLFYYRFEKKGPYEWQCVRASILSEEMAHRENIKSDHEISGRLEIGTPSLKCPYCGNPSFFKCGQCGHLSCWDGNSQTVTCAWDGSLITLQGTIDSIRPFKAG